MVVPSLAQFDFSHLTHAEEIALIRQLSRFPEAVEGAALHCEPHRLVFYLQDLAAQLHSYYNRHRVLDEDPQTTSARLYLVNAVRIILANALRLLGVSAPEQM